LRKKLAFSTQNNGKLRKILIATFVFLENHQFFLGTTYQNGKKYTKGRKSVPNGHKIDQMAKF
jgi:hypothetical protein